MIHIYKNYKHLAQSIDRKRTDIFREYSFNNKDVRYGGIFQQAVHG